MSIDATRAEELLAAVGALLDDGQEVLRPVLVGGAALALRGYCARTTEDVDVITLLVDGEFSQTPSPYPLGSGPLSRESPATSACPRTGSTRSSEPNTGRGCHPVSTATWPGGDSVGWKSVSQVD